ncbi:hypothetical protein SAMN05444156_0065 [Verrucomicrobium sp. GAS474]|uniref:sulfite exporter TauE/SafE family protein n=1 Tax=Verrucomicrobium sp. GAS474 TaxID=1882831 RepID=UPI00087DC35C|nr:sulfite exporter TauE/SafE family protein [Verrucomicrobium sp. GAS474]SDT85868.1 hypothetical protein SAMN05444156_0065 [Verrucomicrobium sp. GAS474]
MEYGHVPAFLLLSVLGLLAGTFSGIVGTGSSLVLMPVLVLLFGPQRAVPVMAVAAILGNAARIAAWWREVDWRAWTAYSITAIPAAALGARTLLALPPRLVEGGLGIFFLLMIPATRWLTARKLRLKTWHLVASGAFIGFLTGIVVTTGPINVPLFLACGLVKGAFLSTEAACSLGVYLSKAIAFRSFNALPVEAVLKGCFVGLFLMLGQFLAKRFVHRMKAETFRGTVDAMLVLSGVTLLWAAWRG